ncbi:MAG TPA: hypothetical protein VHU87_14570 [Rhizomicrobium sp.]|jgi:hypothetical protein|nr:hypothetical protein [Rhizomicrobium sp.]
MQAATGYRLIVRIWRLSILWFAGAGMFGIGSGRGGDARWLSIGPIEFWWANRGRSPEPLKLKKLPADYSYREHFKTLRKSARKMRVVVAR